MSSITPMRADAPNNNSTHQQALVAADIPSSGTISSSSTVKRTRRPRAIQACNFCRSKKYKCDGAWPCAPCQKHREECVFRGANPGASGPVYSSNYVKDLERRLKAAEQAVEDIHKGGKKTSLSSPSESADVLTPSSGAHYGDSNLATTTSPQVMKSTEIRDPSAHHHSDGASEDGQTEVVGVDPVTRSIEFHGNSSSVAFLNQVRREYSPGSSDDGRPQRAGSEKASLVNAFQNTNFLPRRGNVIHWNDGSEDRLFSPQLYIFIETYFSNLHFIHPLIDQQVFLARCEDLWQGCPERQGRSFIALYFAVLSLGALIKTWPEEKINGMGRFDWSRMLYDKAETTLGKPGDLNDLEAIQTLFIMAKVCQNELNPNLAYINIGLAIRIALSVGLNRNALPPGKSHADDPKAQEICKTWWGLYSLEIELSFALGRPDTLGLEDYHNRPKPPVEGNEFDILSSMLPMARIMRDISISIYLSKQPMADKLAKAFQIENDVERWVQSLPNPIRPDIHDTQQREQLRDPNWARLQRLVLQIRYYNVRMLLLRPFILQAAKIVSQKRPLPPRMDEAIFKCTDSAVRTIDKIYETCRIHTFFRTWWYNTTYVTFASSILLFCAAQPALPAPAAVSPIRENAVSPYLSHIDKSLEILEAMNESVVARKTVEVTRQMLERLHQREYQRENSAQRAIAAMQEQVQQQAHQHWAAVRPDARYGVLLPETIGADSFGLGMWDFSGNVAYGGEWDFPHVGGNVGGQQMYWPQQ